MCVHQAQDGVLQKSIAISIAILFQPSIAVAIAILFASIANNPG